MKKIIIICIVVLINVLSFTLLFFLKGKEKEKEPIRDPFEELVVFAEENKEEIAIVSEFLLKHLNEISMEVTPLDYETMIQSEDDETKQAFRTVFQKVGFSYDTITKDEKDVIYFFYLSLDGTEYGVTYFGSKAESKAHTLDFYKEYGQSKQISDEIYVYQYHLNYT